MYNSRLENQQKTNSSSKRNLRQATMKIPKACMHHARTLNSRQKRIVGSAQVSKICEFIIRDAVDEETRCRMIIETIRLLSRQGNHVEAGDVIDELHKAKKLPKNFCTEIIREENLIAEVALASTEITARQSLALDDTALSTMYCWLQSKNAQDMLSTIIRVNGKKLMGILLKERPRIVCHLIQHGNRAVREDILNLLLTAAKDDTSPIITDILETCVHSERWTEKGNRILEIARIVNPIDPPDSTRADRIIPVDTTYLMNWGRKRRYFLSPGNTEIQNLIGELCKLIKGSPALECLQNMLELNRTVDLLMFLPHKRYRGHDIHQFNVATLGLLFLDIHVRNNQHLSDYLASSHQDQFCDPSEVEKAWLLTSLLHDHALPISHMFKIAPLIHKIREDRSRKSYGKAVVKLQRALELTYFDLFSKPIRRVYKSFVRGSVDATVILEKLISKEMSKIRLHGVAQNGLDHGVLAAANMTSRFKNAPIEKIVETSAKAIGLHNLMDEKISFKEDPLAFLLVLCDELQEWGREIAIFPEILIDTSSISIGKFHIDGGKLFFTDDLHVSFRFLTNTEKLTRFDPRLFMEEKKAILDKRLVFDDPNAFPPIHCDDPTFGI